MIKRALALGLLFVGLMCSGFSYSGEQSHVTFEVMEDYVEESEEFGTVKLDGRYIKLPCKVSLFTELGYSVNSDVDKVFPAKTESYGVRVYDTNGRELTLFVRNDDITKHAVEDCMVWSVGYKPVDDVDYGYLDFAMSGVTPESIEKDMVDKLGLPGSTLEWNGVKSVMWSTKKDEYTINIEYSSDGIVSMRLTADTPANKLEDAVKMFYDEKYPTDVELPKPAPIEKKSISKILIWVLVGIPVTVILVGAFLVILAIRAHHKQRMAEIDAAILNTPIEEITDDLEDKYNI